MSVSQLPSEEHVQNLLTNLFGEDVPVRPTDSPNVKTPVTASYVNDEGVATKRLTCDLQFAFRVGAALTRIPPGTVDEAIEAGEIPESIRDNLHEVLNICVNLFPTSNGAHLVLDNVAFEANENENSASLPASEDIVTFDVDIPNYGPGVMTLVHCS